MEARIRALVNDYDRFVGIDHHKKTSYLTVKDGTTLKRGSIPTSREALTLFSDGDGDEDSRTIAAFEAGRCYRPMAMAFRRGGPGCLSHAGGLKLISDTVYEDDLTRRS